MTELFQDQLLCGGRPDRAAVLGAQTPLGPAAAD
jgi:hypothetical protein